MLALLEMLYNPNPPPGSRLVDPEIRQALETHVAGQYGARLRDESFWNSRLMEGVSVRLRKTADGVAARHPSVSSEELAKATATVSPELERRRQRRQQRGGQNFADLAPIIITAVIAMSFALMLLLSVVSSLIVSGGLFTRMLGHAVVTRNGMEIGRMLSLARVLVAWAPAIAWLLYLAASPKVQGFVPVPPNPLLGTVLAAAALVAGAALTVVRPSRGPHDWLLGTRVVPR
jgi:hypothetical protein